MLLLFPKRRRRALILKAHVKGYTKRDGTFVKPHEDKRKSAKVDTASEFEKWFAGSKIVDEDGKPRVVYHGTAADFDAFDAAFRGSNTGASGAERAFFFAGHPNDSDLYLELSRSKAEQTDEGVPTGRVIRAYLAAKNPLILTPFEEANVPEDIVQELIDDDTAALDYARGNGYDAVVWPHGNMSNSAYTAAVFKPEQIRILK